MLLDIPVTVFTDKFRYKVQHISIALSQIGLSVVSKRWTDVLELVVLTVRAYCPSLEGRINTLPSRLRLISMLAASSREHSMNHLHMHSDCQWIISSSSSSCLYL